MRTLVIDENDRYIPREARVPCYWDENRERWMPLVKVRDGRQEMVWAKDWHTAWGYAEADKWARQQGIEYYDEI